jgi:hypothetical protein
MKSLIKIYVVIGLAVGCCSSNVLAGLEEPAYNDYKIGPNIALNTASQDPFSAKPTTRSAIPEPSTVIAGALLLLPLGVSMVRILRRNRPEFSRN